MAEQRLGVADLPPRVAVRQPERTRRLRDAAGLLHGGEQRDQRGGVDRALAFRRGKGDVPPRADVDAQHICRWWHIEARGRRYRRGVQNASERAR
jgi:hypothetical protein